jgi:hypothetical protein
MRNTYIIIIALFILAGALVVNFLPSQGCDSCLLHDQMASLSLLLPQETDFPDGVPAEASPHVGQIVPGGIRPVPAPPLTPIPASPQQPVPTQEIEFVPLAPLPQEQAPSGIAAPPVSYVYFYTGVPVWSVPKTTIIYSGGQTVAVSAPVAPMMPVVQPYSVPVFVPQVVPSRVGAPKLVYSNGVVIKPKVYYPRQPLRNSIRGVTP